MEKENTIPQISIIVPVYKAEKYIHRCIASILAQTFTDFELILVDDGSPDNCPEICDEYAENDNRVIVIHKENGGVSSARNAGIKASKGRFIQFVDADDWIQNKLCEKIYKTIDNDSSDIVFFGFKLEDKNGKLIKEKKAASDSADTNLKNYAITLFQLDIFGYTWCKLYKAAIIKQYDLLFNEQISLCEDEEFTCRYYCFVKKISVLDIADYHYIRYGSEHKTLTTVKYKNELIIRDKLFLEWVNMLEQNNKGIFKKYLGYKAYKILYSFFWNIVWLEDENSVKKAKAQRLKLTVCYKYILQNNLGLKAKILISLIKYKQFFLFRIFDKVNYSFIKKLNCGWY